VFSIPVNLQICGKDPGHFAASQTSPFSRHEENN